MKKVIASAGLLAFGAAGLQNAHAFDLAPGPDKPWSIQGTLRGFYDDNYNTLPDGPNRRGSWGFEIRPQANIKYSEGPTSLTASYIYSLKDYTDRPGNKIDQAHEFDLSVNHSFNERFSADAEESFVSSQEPEVLSGAGPTSTPLRANGDNYHNSASINFHAQATKLFGVVLGYNNSWYDYTGNPANQAPGAPSYGSLLNSITHTFTLDGRYTIDDETVAIMEYKFAATYYTGAGSIGNIGPISIPSDSRNVYSHFIDAGIEHSFRSDLSLNVHAGVEVTDYYQAPSFSDPSSVSPYADISLSYTYTDGGVLQLGFTHSKNSTDVAVTGTGLTTDAESSTLYLTATQTLKPLSPDLTASVSFQYQDSTFNGNNSAGGEDFYTVAVNLTYNFTRYLSGEVGYNYDLLDSAILGRGYDRNRVYVGVTATY